MHVLGVAANQNRKLLLKPLPSDHTYVCIVKTVERGCNKIAKNFDSRTLQCFAFQLQRLTKAPVEKIPDSDRRVTKSMYNNMGVVSSYAWKGYN